ncbi:methylenetetrahydrofolate reductase [Acinetobacter puyangensis]
MSTLATYFSKRQFCFSIEYIEHGQTQLDFIQDIAGDPTCVAIADRVHADEDRAPIEITQSLISNTSVTQQNVLLHYSGKGRDISDLKQFLQEAAQRQYFDVLMLTGDRLKNHDFGQTQPKQRSRYLESVNSVMYAKQADSRFHLGVAFNPFKYTESEREAQYLKLHKKIKAGADFIVTQLGYDLLQLKQLQLFLTQHAYHIPVMVCVMPLTYARAKSI